MLVTDFAQEELLFQLTNVGGISTPVRTTTSSNSTTPGSVGSKKWSERFSKFSKSKKISNSTSGNSAASKMPDIHLMPSEISQLRTGIVTPKSPSTSHFDLPQRSSSIPRPESHMMLPHLPVNMLSPNSSKTPGSLSAPPKLNLRDIPPRIKPFDYPQLATRKKSYINEICCLCYEAISYRAYGEKVISLKCQHLVHEGCLLATFEYSFSPDSNDMFPRCGKCDDGVRCQPLDFELKDRIISQVLIHGSPRRKKANHSTSTNMGTPQYLLEKENIHSNSSNSRSDCTGSPVRAKRNFKDLSLRISNRIPTEPKTAIRGSVISAVSSIVSSISKTSPAVAHGENSTESYSASSIPQALLRSYYIQILLSNFPGGFSDWEIDAKFGPLRLVDRLMYAEDGKTYQDACCFLFTNALIVAPIVQGFKSNNPIGIKLLKYTVFSPLTDVTVATMDSSVFKCMMHNEVAGTNLVQGIALYLTETLNSNSSKVVQKWISALLDSHIVFDCETFSSTLSFPSIVKDICGNKESNIQIGTSCSGVEFSHEVYDNDVIVRRSIIGTEKPESRRTTITSLLSLKRERPDDLIVVLQLNLESLTDNDVVMIQNSLKALTFKIEDAKICIVDALGRVITHGFIHQCLAEVCKAKIQSDGRSRATFSPQLLKSWFDTGTTRNLAIGIFSNTSMKEDKSCLFMNYEVFAKRNRRKPNELKVKVGCLNFDYTDKIFELVEIPSWNNLLEIACYSFNMSFEDDDDSIDSNDEEKDESATSIALRRTESPKADKDMLDHESPRSVGNDVASTHFALSNEKLGDSNEHMNSLDPLTVKLSKSNNSLESVRSLSVFEEISSSSLLAADRSKTNEFVNSPRPAQSTIAQYSFNEFSLKHHGANSPMLSLEEVRWSSFLEGISKALDEAIQRQTCNTPISPDSDSEPLSLNYL